MQEEGQCFPVAQTDRTNSWSFQNTGACEDKRIFDLSILEYHILKEKSFLFEMMVNLKRFISD